MKRKTPLNRKTWMKRGKGFKKRSPQEDGKPAPYHRLIRKKSFSQLKQRKPVAKKSSKRKVEEVEYRRLSKEFLSLHPVCEGCVWEHIHEGRRILNPATEIHHKARRSFFYLRVDTWMAVCRVCHEKIESNPLWSKKNGFLLSQEEIRRLKENSPNSQDSAGD